MKKLFFCFIFPLFLFSAAPFAQEPVNSKQPESIVVPSWPFSQKNTTVRDWLYRSADEPSQARLAYREAIKGYDGLFFQYRTGFDKYYPFILSNKRTKVCYPMYPSASRSETELKAIYDVDKLEFSRGTFQGMKQEVKSNRKNKIYVGGIEFYRRASDTPYARRVMLSCSDNRFAFRFESVGFYNEIWDNKHYVGETIYVQQACSAFLDSIDSNLKRFKKEPMPASAENDIIIFGLDTYQNLYTVQISMYDAGYYKNPFYGIVKNADDVIEKFIDMMNCLAGPEPPVPASPGAKANTRDGINFLNPPPPVPGHNIYILQEPGKGGSKQ